jgi:hypothetical protein
MVWCKILALQIHVVHVYASINFEGIRGNVNLIKKNFYAIFSITQFVKDMKLTVCNWRAHLFYTVHDATYFRQHKA